MVARLLRGRGVSGSPDPHVRAAGPLASTSGSPRARAPLPQLLRSNRGAPKASFQIDRATPSTCLPTTATASRVPDEGPILLAVRHGVRGHWAGQLGCHTLTHWGPGGVVMPWGSLEDTGSPRLCRARGPQAAAWERK